MVERLTERLASERVPDACCIVVGSGDDPLAVRTEDGGTDRVTMLKRLTDLSPTR
jgi:hypothetical protein